MVAPGMTEMTRPGVGKMRQAGLAVLDEAEWGPSSCLLRRQEGCLPANLISCTPYFAYPPL